MNQRRRLFRLTGGSVTERIYRVPGQQQAETSLAIRGARHEHAFDHLKRIASSRDIVGQLTAEQSDWHFVCKNVVSKSYWLRAVMLKRS